MPVPVGIDLGTTYSCVAALINGKVEVIANDFGHRTTPSAVAFVDGEDDVLVGEAALSQAARNPANTIVDAKRLIGCTWNDESVQSDVTSWPFQVGTAGGSTGGQLQISVTHNGEAKSFAPMEISAMVLRKMKKTAEDFLGEDVSEAVITIPAYFSESQRRDTREAGVLAGLNVLRLIPEPSAAALAYGLERQFKDEQEKKVLIYDLGGGTFDVSVATVSPGRVLVRGTGGNSHLGGQDFDQRIYKHVSQEIRRKLGRDVLAGEPRRARRLLELCERAKRDLSAMTCTEIDADPVALVELSVVLTQARLEDLCKDLLAGTLQTVRDVLANAKMTADDLDEVILVGGSTRMPCVERMLAAEFPGLPISKTINPDEAVAYGAALWAAFLSKKGESACEQKVVVQNVTPLSLGVAADGGVFQVLIPRNTPLPVRQTMVMYTIYVNQCSMTIKVYQGERQVADRNKLVGEYTLGGLPPSAHADLPIDMALTLDEDGILEVQAKTQNTRCWQGCVLTLDERSTTEVVAHAEDAERYREQDQQEVERLMARHDLDIYLNNELAMNRGNAAVENAIRRAQAWFEAHQSAYAEEFEDVLSDVQTQLEGLVLPRDSRFVGKRVRRRRW